MRRVATLSVSVAAIFLAAHTAQARQDVTIERMNVAPLDLWSAEGRPVGMSSDLWRGASGDLARQVLSDLPVRTLSPAYATFARRVFAQGAPAPDGFGNDTGLAGQRVRALIALGDPEAAYQILARTPNIAASSSLSRPKAEASLYLQREDEACDTERALQEDRNTTYWLKLRAYCQVRNKEMAAAQVTLDLWRSQGGKDAPFETMMTAALLGTKTRPAASLRDSLDLTLSRRLGLDLGAAIRTSGPAVAAALARDESLPLALRQQAAARAMRAGVLSFDFGRDLYIPAPVRGDAGGPPPPPSLALTLDLEALAKDLSVTGEARLVERAALSDDPIQREQAVLILLRRAQTLPDLVALSRLSAPRLKELARARMTFADPLLFSAAAALAGDVDTAKSFRVFVNVSPVATSGYSAIDVAWLDAVIAVSAGEPAQPALDALLERGLGGDARTKTRAQSAAILLAAMETPRAPAARARLAAFEQAPGKAAPSRLIGLGLAAEAGTKGDVALNTLAIAMTAAQTSPTTGPLPADRALSVMALSRVGLKEEARRLAVEGLMALLPQLEARPAPAAPVAKPKV